jgi:hypothetical protein
MSNDKVVEFRHPKGDTPPEATSIYTFSVTVSVLNNTPKEEVDRIKDATIEPSIRDLQSQFINSLNAIVGDNAFVTSKYDYAQRPYSYKGER